MSLRDTIVVLVSVFILAACGYFFYQETAAREREGEDPVGKIYFRYRVAETRPAKRVVWDGVNQGDPVFNRDSVRTDELSEAIIVLDDETSIEMDPETMIILDLRNEKPVIQFEQGSILIRRDKESEIQVKAGNTKIEMKSGTARVTKSEDGLDISAVSGDLKLEEPPEDVPAGSTLSINGDQTDLKATKPALIGPPDNTRYFTTEPGYAVTFSFEGSDCDGQRAQLILKPLEGDAQTIQSPRDDVTSMLAEGIYYWYVQCGTSRSQTRKVRIIRMNEIELAYPANGQRFSAGENGNSIVAFSWITLQLAADYTISVATDSSFTNVVKTQTTRKSSISFRLPEGTYYWKVTANAAAPGAKVTSVTGNLSVEKDIKEEVAVKITDEDEDEKEEEKKEVKRPVQKPLRRPVEKKPVEKKPEVTAKEETNTKETEVSKPEELKPKVTITNPEVFSPKNGATLDMSKQDAIVFTWRPVQTATRYTVSFRGPAGSGSNFSTTATAYRFSDLSKLDVGRFSVTVTAYKESQKLSQATSSFFIILSEGPEKPELEVQ